VTIILNTICQISVKGFYPAAQIFTKTEKQFFLREKTIPQCQAPSQNQEATQFQEYSLPLPYLLDQTLV
jgi:hypothetical protein